jgi:ABC-type transporter Mla subunit MlaD
MRNIISEYIPPEMVASVQRTIDNIGTFAAAASPVANNLSKLLEPRTVAQVAAPDSQLQANLSTVVERLDAFVGNLNEVLGDAEVQDDVKSVVRDVKQSAEEFRGMVAQWKSDTGKLVENLNTSIDHTEANLDRSFGSLNDVLQNLDGAATSLAKALTAVAEGQGTAGKFIRDERLYEAAVLSMQRFGESMATLDRVLRQIEAQGYFRIGTPTSGPLNKEFPLPTQTPPRP